MSGVEEGAEMVGEDQIGGMTVTEVEGRGIGIEMGLCHEIRLTEGADPVLLSGMGIGGHQEAQFDHIN